MAWSIQVLQSVIFTPDVVAADDLFFTLFDRKPTAFQTTTQPFLTSVAQEQQPDRTMMLQVTPGRIDIFATPPDPKDARSLLSQVLPEPSAMADLMLGATVRLTEKLAVVTRVAWVARHVHPVDDAKSANELFVRETGVPASLMGSLESAFQTNHQMPMPNRPGALLNRIIHWKTERQQVFEFAMGGQPITAHAVPSSAEAHAVTLNLDVNIISPDQNRPLDSSAELVWTLYTALSDLQSIRLSKVDDNVG